MKISDTISVNPGKNTLGNVGASDSTIFRSQVIGEATSRQSKDVFKIIFPTTLSASSEFRKYEVPLRTLFATILIVAGLTSILGSQSIAMAICTLCFGTFLAIGLLTRPVMLSAAIYYCIMGALALRSGVADMTIFSLMFGCLIFAVVGAGKYSCDTLIRGFISRHKKATVKKRKEEMMGYKAFHHVKF